MQSKDGYLLCIGVLSVFMFIVFMVLTMIIADQLSTISELSMNNSKCYCECCNSTPTIVE